MKITGTTRLAGIMGWPVAHSRSPALHGFWLDETGIDGAYVPLPVQPEQMEQALRALPALGFRGFNLTIPHKQAALSIVDRVEPLARRIGAVNTIIVAPDGSRSKAATPMPSGFARTCASGARIGRPAAGPAVVLGAGGAARAVVAALTDAGVAEIRIVNRTLARAEALARDLRHRRRGSRSIPGARREAAQRDAGLLVNTTSLGMTGEPPLDDRSVAVAADGAGRRHRLCAARNGSAARRAAARPPHGRWSRHAAASGPARI